MRGNPVFSAHLGTNIRKSRRCRKYSRRAVLSYSLGQKEPIIRRGTLLYNYTSVQAAYQSYIRLSSSTVGRFLSK
jgi:hypothetical protein